MALNLREHKKAARRMKGVTKILKYFRLIILYSVLNWNLNLSPVPEQMCVFGQQQSQTIRMNTSLVTLPVRVTDPVGHFVKGLTQSDFQIFEDGKPQEIISFSASEEPFNVALLIDTSRSARNWLDTIQKSAISFVKQLQPQDRILVVTFDEGVTFRGDFSNDRKQLQQAINSVKSSYLTSVYDGIMQTISDKFSGFNGRKAIVIFTDGIDTASRRATCESVLKVATHSGVLCYVVQYNELDSGVLNSPPCRLPLGQLPERFISARKELKAEVERRIIATNFLKALADQSGARYLQAGDIQNLGYAFTQIADELRHQYVLEYYSTNDQQDGEYRTIAVQLKRDNLKVHTRKGYQSSKINEGRD